MNNWLSIIAPSIAAGNALAASYSDNPADVNAFEGATPVFPVGTTFSAGATPISPPVASNPPSGYYLGVAVSDVKRAQAEAILAAGLPPGFNAEVGDRSVYEARWSEFISSNGYVIP